MNRNMKCDLKESLCAMKPRALKEWGLDVFIEVPLYEACQKYSPLYINEALFRDYFRDDNTEFTHMAEVIQQYFSTTLDVNKSNGKQIGLAYVDRQADPLNISLNDNLGSGRAFYQYDIFNIKGEKTPLATSERDEYSNGVLELEKAMFETIASNSLYQDVNIKLSPILAILDIHENCRVGWKKSLCKRAKVIRLDLNGSLNRITHLFQSKRPLTKKSLTQTSRKMGMLEGEKFIQRIQHGAWSAGNISEHAHMIDFDTVCAARYRAPQYSFTKWFIDNYFGQEYLGQLKILKSLVKAEEINVDKVPYSVLKRELIQSRKNYINQNFARLMGFERIDSRYLPAISRLVQKMMKLASRCYPDAPALELKFLESQFCSPFNFSKFFRYYPILRRCEDWDAYLGLEYLIDCVREFPEFDLKTLLAANEDEHFFNTTVLKHLDLYFIHSPQELVDLSTACLTFIQEYDALFQRILKDTPKAKGKTEARAYIFNEDRLHLFMPHSMAGPIDDERDTLSYEHIHNIIKYTILSNKRSGMAQLNGIRLSNMEIFKEGYFATLHNDRHQHRLSLALFAGVADINPPRWPRIRVNGEFYPCDIQTSPGLVSLQSPWFDNLNLLEGRYRDIQFYDGEDVMVLNQFVFSFTETPQIQNFAAVFNRP